MKIESDKVTLDLRQLIIYIIKKIWVILLFACIVGGISYGYSKFFITPAYSSQCLVYVGMNSSSRDHESKDEAGYLACDYMELIGRRGVTERVKEELNLTDSVEAIQAKVSVSFIENSRLVKVIVTEPDAQQAMKIANAYGKVASEYLPQLLDSIDKPIVVEEATLATSFATPNLKKNAILGAILGILIGGVAVCISFVVKEVKAGKK